jgi:hypothetical protein
MKRGEKEAAVLTLKRFPASFHFGLTVGGRKTRFDEKPFYTMAGPSSMISLAVFLTTFLSNLQEISFPLVYLLPYQGL